VSIKAQPVCGTQWMFYIDVTRCGNASQLSAPVGIIFVRSSSGQNLRGATDDEANQGRARRTRDP
jgi:hypothetical protein